MGKRYRLNNKFTNLILDAVSIIANSIEAFPADLDFRYKAAISYIYKILAVIYLEKAGLISDKLYKQVDYIITSNDSVCLFDNILNFQLNSLGINDKFFNSYRADIDDSNFFEFIKILNDIIQSDFLEIETFGYLYEHLQQFCIESQCNSNATQLKLSFELESERKYSIIHSGLVKKKQGSYFTPPELIDYLIESGLKEKLAQISSLNDLLQLKILDPACGGGNILLRVYFELYKTALERFGHYSSREELKTLILRNCIFGIDIDDFACDVTALTLFLASGKTAHFGNIICGNFLIDNLNGYDKNIDLAGLFLNNQDKFSLIIGNPPYLNIENIEKTEKKYYLDNYKSAYRRFDIYLLFIEKSLQLLKNDGTISFIIPDKFLTQSYAKKSRELILKNCAVKEIISFKNPNLFKNASVMPVIIAISPDRNNIKPVKVKEILANEERLNTVDQDSWLSMFDFNFRIRWNADRQEIIETIQSKSFPLCELCYVSWGAQPGDARKFIFNNSMHVDSAYRDYLRPLITGGNIDRYGIVYDNKYLLYLTEGDFKLHRPAFVQLFESEKIVVAEVTALKGIVASFDNTGLYTNHSIINCVNKRELLNLTSDIMNSRNIKLYDTNDKALDKYRWQEDERAYIRGCSIYKDSRFHNISLKYALSIINSKLVSFYFKNFLSGDLNVFPGLVKFLPVFDIDTASHITDTGYLEDILDRGCFDEVKNLITGFIEQNSYADIHNSFSLITDKLIHLKKASRIPEFLILDDILNNSIFKLYGLTESQIEYVKTDTEHL